MQKVIIENFGPIKSAEIEIRPFTIVIGEQASGKSYLSKMVYFFKKLPTELFDFVFFQNNNISTEDLSNEIKRIFINTFKTLNVNKQEFSAVFYYETEAFIKISNKQNRIGVESNVFDNLTSISNDIISKRNDYKKKFSGSDGWEPKFFRDFSKFFNNEYQDYNTNKEIYIPAGRALLNAFPKDITYDILRNPLLSEDFKGFIRRVERIKQEFISKGGTFESMSENRQGYYNEDVGEILLTIIQQILKAKYSGDENGEKFIFNKNKFVTLENASSGQQESLRVLQDLFLLFVEENSGFRAIEEPEAHLFPTAQKKLIEFISIITNSTGSSLFISTHSPYILSAFNNLLFAKGVEKEFGASFSAKMTKDDNSILPVNSAWIDPDNFIAYSLKAGDKCFLIFDMETGMIDENYLDDVSMEIADEFNVMFDIYKKLKQ
ncbi:MAG: ATP-binding protein [Bacteroidales bacterium]|nr:ATP-binding protein [Bacteroidales bacterium]